MKNSILLLMIVFLFSCINQTDTEKQNENKLPRDLPEFKGKIGRTFEDSEQDYPQPYRALKGSPNVILVLLDDVGFGQAGTFGGPIPTPSLDKLASEGLTYTQFHTTGICSPTRAALLTGRNHHQLGFGTISELSTGYPGYHSIWGRDGACIAEVLKQSGYNTAAWGKWHNTPDWETSPIGPFDRWPTGLGFEYFYGFQGGETSQWEPQLFRNTLPVEPGKTPEEGYHLTEDLAQDAIKWIQQQKSLDPEKPYFVYFAPGAAHAPLHVPKEWIDKFKGQFDEGWDVMREYTLERQKKIVFAGFLAHVEYWVSQLIDEAHSLPGGDNTMVIYVVGDNGASGEGSMGGTLNSMEMLNGFPGTDVETQLAVLDEIGGPKHENHYAVPWSWAGDAPFQWMKRVPSHFGGTRNGMIISWPKGIKANNKKRTQFHHVVDIAPTIYEAAGIEIPSSVNGVDQSPMAGVSMNYSFEDANAEGTRKTQYFEVGGHRAIYHDGWVAASFHGVPWETKGSLGFDNDIWQLYNIEEDFSQANDLVEQYPEKLKELISIFDNEAEKYGVYPLDDRFIDRSVNPERPSLTRGKTSFTYLSGTARIPEGSAPPAYRRDHTITAQIEYAPGDEGVIVANGGSAAGYTFYIQNNKLHYTHNFFQDIYDVTSKTNLPKGELKVKMVYTQESKEWGGGGTAKLYVNGNEVGSGKIDKVVPGRYSATETLDIGKDLGAPVSEHYQTPFEFTGKIDYVQIDLN
jgi:arylsulfatase